jgi:hypothetical protein
MPTQSYGRRATCQWESPKRGARLSQNLITASVTSIADYFIADSSAVFAQQYFVGPGDRLQRQADAPVSVASAGQ